MNDWKTKQKEMVDQFHREQCIYCDENMMEYVRDDIYNINQKQRCSFITRWETLGGIKEIKSWFKEEHEPQG